MFLAYEFSVVHQEMFMICILQRPVNSTRNYGNNSKNKYNHGSWRHLIMWHVKWLCVCTTIFSTNINYITFKICHISYNLSNHSRNVSMFNCLVEFSPLSSPISFSDRGTAVSVVKERTKCITPLTVK